MIYRYQKILTAIILCIFAFGFSSLIISSFGNSNCVEPINYCVNKIENNIGMSLSDSLIRFNKFLRNPATYNFQVLSFLILLSPLFLFFVKFLRWNELRVINKKAVK